MSALADASVLRTLTRRGYVLRGFENVLGLELDRRFSAPAPPAGLRIEPVAARSSTAWVSALADGFIAPSDPSGPEPHESLGREALERVFEDAGHVAGLERHLALRDGTTAGGASMRIADGVAQLCGAATRPEHRRRGVQTALVQHRLAIAARRGCDLAIVTTQPGSESQRNLQRHGFALLYARAILVLPR